MRHLVGVSDDPPLLDVRKHDVRLHVGQWFYYVRAVRRGESLTGGLYSLRDMAILVPLFLAMQSLQGRGLYTGVGLAMLVPLRLVFRRVLKGWQTRQPWKIGVVRIRGDRWGPVGDVKVVHREMSTGGELPTSQLELLAERVRAGEFAA